MDIKLSISVSVADHSWQAGTRCLSTWVLGPGLRNHVAVAVIEMTAIDTKLLNRYQITVISNWNT